MKIVNVVNPKISFKTVNFHGVEFDNVPEEADWIAADADGVVHSYTHLYYKEQPTINHTYYHWVSSECADYLGDVNLEGMDWRDTLIKI